MNTRCSLSQVVAHVQAFLAARKGPNKRRGSPSSVLSLAGSPNDSVGSDSSAPSSRAQGSDAASVPNYAEVRRRDGPPCGGSCTVMAHHKQRLVSATAAGAVLSADGLALQVDPEDVQICTNADGEPWLLGTGAYGQVLLLTQLHIQIEVNSSVKSGNWVSLPDTVIACEQRQRRLLTCCLRSKNHMWGFAVVCHHLVSPACSQKL